ncbi:uncharacterized protein N7459_005004 [Penicillium hispanicum]|uniref:uncharacterized protein n=1 Tax=Penicillium hispanicum TaxID=1080232 RepID=UPI002540CAB9|nr:uncharacterized protein N7459_005004 [Penicillium hispanicum]KAJ5585204.1 hypothetical protein N7459_005004 [Penicillium hispanicum]
MENHRRHRRKRNPLSLSVILLALLDPAAAVIPYTPSYAFLSAEHNDSLAYLIQPSSTTAGNIEFLSLNISSSIDTSNPSFHTLLAETPFQSTSEGSAFLPAIDDHGAITVYVGDCHNSSAQPVLWRFQPDNSSYTGNGSWSQVSVGLGQGDTRPNYLAAGFTFAPSKTSQSSMYTFGGMCPFENTTNQTWVSAANYSQSMVMLSPATGQSTKYDAVTTGNRAPPVAEAGMAIVPLSATFPKTETQQNFLLIGGHTRQAFLNMSQLAVFSVPQESWSFVTVNSEGIPRTELAVRQQPPVEPRSGHAAVLSEDGTKVFVIGGWVGDTSVPADPQLAILELGEEYGGTGEWTWTAASSEGAGIADGTGLFGHSAVMLPGGVLMIAGGYTIPKQSSKRSASSATHNSKVYLYNSTSSSWVTSYTNPSSLSSPASRSHEGGLSTGQKAGLGVGIGLGLPLAILILFCAWKYYRRRTVRGKRDSQLRELALGAERSHFWGRDEPYQASSIRSSQMSEKQDTALTYPWAGSRSHTTRPSWKEQGDASAERAGLLMDSHSPGKNSRPESRAEGRPHSQTRPYRPSGHTDWRRSDTPSSEIHPIDEREEDEEILRERLMATIPTERNPQVPEPEDPFTDTPFGTPRSTIFGVGLGPFYSRRKDIGAVEGDGRVSPTRSDRTSTNLSDASSFSFSSKRTGHVSQARAVLVDRPLSWASHGRQSFEQLALRPTRSRETTHSNVDANGAPSEKSFSTDSYSTAHTTISERAAENTSLLFDADTTITPITPTESSPSKLPRESKPTTSEWMLQTVRRALTLTRRSTAAQEDPDIAPLASGIDRRSTVIGAGPNPAGSGANTPRRAVSASAELFRRKQGARDWNAKKRLSDNTFSAARSTRDDLFIGAPGYLGDDDTFDDDDWDVEDAAEGRRVQMTYTVPREKLRVVNATAGDMDNISERSTSRNFSAPIGPRRVSSS